MIARVLGTREIDFKAKDGKQVSGTQIFVAYKDTNSRSTAQGEVTEKIFISHDSDVRVPVFEFGKEYDFQYESTGFGSHARPFLSCILTKDGKEPKYAADTDPLFRRVTSKLKSSETDT